MPRSVFELCSEVLFTVRGNMPARAALQALQQRRIHGAPVVLDGGRAVGVVTLGDLTGDLGELYVADRMSESVVAVEADTPVDQAARTLAEHGVHHLVVTESGCTVGFLSALDLVRALLGMPRPTLPTEKNSV